MIKSTMQVAILLGGISSCISLEELDLTSCDLGCRALKICSAAIKVRVPNIQVRAGTVVGLGGRSTKPSAALPASSTQQHQQRSWVQHQ
jgi:hypothetical protein